MHRLAAALASALLAAPAVMADEPAPVIWDTALGPVTYALEDGLTAILEYAPPFADGGGRFFIHGLGGEFGGPGPLDGYWSEPDSGDDAGDTQAMVCPFAIVDDQGRTTRNWGRLRLMFTGDDFPGDFVMLRGRCLEDPGDVLNGRLRL